MSNKRITIFDKLAIADKIISEYSNDSKLLLDVEGTMMEEVKWLVSKNGTHTCSNCGSRTPIFTRNCPVCNADMGYTVKRMMKYKCGCCHGLFEKFAYRYDASPNGDDVCVCPLCGCEEPDVEEVWGNEVDN